jgi:pimeloyl-ACP methyl ester carboxylesterase
MPLTSSTLRSFLIGTAAGIAVVAAAFVLWHVRGPRAITISTGQFPEELVYVQAKDDVASGGAMFRPPAISARPFAVIWIHGWGANFYSPTYVAIGRALAARGLTTISVNTRMHDIANVQQYRWGKRVRGGGYWGVPSEQVRDLKAWLDFAETQGFPRAVLVGHSAGWAAVRAYLAEQRDPRVVGMVLASGQAQPGSTAADPQLIEQATRFVNSGQGDELLRLPNRSFPSFVSAATFLDDYRTPPDILDFFGVRIGNPAVARVRCPILAFYGTRGDVGNEAELQVLKSAIERQTNGPRQVTVAMIQDADHMYTGEEQQVARIISDWIDAVVLASTRGT